MSGSARPDTLRSASDGSRHVRSGIPGGVAIVPPARHAATRDPPATDAACRHGRPASGESLVRRRVASSRGTRFNRERHARALEVDIPRHDPATTRSRQPAPRGAGLLSSPPSRGLHGPPVSSRSRCRRARTHQAPVAGSAGRPRTVLGRPATRTSARRSITPARPGNPLDSADDALRSDDCSSPGYLAVSSSRDLSKVC